MAINLLGIEPHKVSRDLSGYITYIYGQPKTGKTTLATQIGNSLLLAFEKGYNALPGVRAQDVNSWGEMKAIVRELKKPEVKQFYKAVIIDTIDIAGGFCEKYVCSQNDVDVISQIPYGQGWNLLKKEFEDVFRTIAMQGYAVFFISHDKDKTFTRADNTEYNQIVPSCPRTLNDIAKNMADIYAFAEKYEENNVAKVRLVLRSLDNSADTGCRFKYIEPVIDMSYSALEKALNDAIDKEAAINNNEFVKNERNEVTEVPVLNYEELITSFQQSATKLMNTDAEYYGPRITFIVEKYLGKGKKVSESTLNQVELINLIVNEINEDLIPTLGNKD